MFEKGKAYFIKTATDYFTGYCIEDGTDCLLDQAAWIADTGRFADALRTGEFSEIEPYPDGMLVRVHAGGVVSSCLWPHKLPRAQK
jgi:hypothetical protein